LNGLVKVILEEGLSAKSSLLPLKNLDGLQGSLAKLSLKEVCEATGLAETELREAARLLGGKESIAILFGSDVIKSGNAEEQVQALANLALVTGCFGKSAGGLFPIEEKNNTQGLLDMGVTPDHLPGYQSYEAGAAGFAKAWGKKLPAGKGKDLWQIIEGIEQGSIKALYLVGSDPLGSFPNAGRIRKALEKLELLVVQDSFPTETAQLAHVLFPAAVAAEKSGSFTTTDHRVQMLNKAVNAPGEAREDGDIFNEIINRLSGGSAPFSASQLFSEIKTLVPGYQGVDAAAGGIVPMTLASEASLVPINALAPAAAPYRLLAGPILFHNGTMSTWSENNLAVAKEGYLELSSADATMLGIATGTAIRVTSPAGSIIGKAKVSGKVQPGLLFAPYHFRELKANALLEGNANLATVEVEKA
jgi:formate dehydrogenase alpha subunit